ncbi:MAG: hypothetical protein OXU98_00290 [Gammaproteobacteria bacterium]|nr:hypothetical protein [Gammaproteobacteria bacterium]
MSGYSAAVAAAVVASDGDAPRAADFIHEAEMGFSHAELLSRLPSAVAPFGIERQSARVYHLRAAGGDGDGDAGDGAGDGHVTLTLQPETVRRLAAIALPVTRVRLEFFNFNAARFDDFMRRFKRYLHKGGG